MEGTIMTIAPTLQTYLDRNIVYGIIPHEPSMTSSRTAQACHVPGGCLAKGVVLRHDGRHVLAVLPASHHLDLPGFKEQFGKDAELASEDEISQLFSDCSRGAVPPIGNCYGLDVFLDDSISDLAEVYMEAGDHETLLCMRQSEFRKLTGGARRARFSIHD
jgi:Ala-tRNA(Pro) deacylase